MPEVDIRAGVADDVPDAATILKHIQVWPDAILDKLEKIQIFPLINSQMEGNVHGRYYPHGFPFSATGKPAVAVREDGFRRRAAGSNDIEFGGFVLDHEMGHHAAQVIFGIYNPRVGFEGVEEGYTQEIADRLKGVYGANGISDLGAHEDLAEALHDWWGRHPSRTRGRELLAEPVLVEWVLGLTTAFAPAPPWVEPRVDRPAAFLRDQATKVDAEQDVAGYTRRAEETIDGLQRMIYALKRDSEA